MKVILVVVLISIIIGVSLAGLGRANPNPVPAPPSITITYSPDFLKNTVTLKVDITVCWDTNNCTREAWYSLDGQQNVSIPLTFKGMIGAGGDFPASQVIGQIDMPMFAQAPHTINVTMKYNYGSFVLFGSKTIYIGQPEPTTPPPPMLTIISPQNLATYSDKVPITYSIEPKISWSYYALDTKGEPTSKEWIYFIGNITLSGLSQGTHKLVISVKPEGHYTYPLSEKTVTFNIGSVPDSNTYTQVPFPSNTDRVPAQTATNLTPTPTLSSFKFTPEAITIVALMILGVVGLTVLSFLKVYNRKI